MNTSEFPAVKSAKKAVQQQAKRYNEPSDNSDIGQLRKELNELRERVAVLEFNALHRPPVVPVVDRFAPPYQVTCGSTGVAGRD